MGVGYRRRRRFPMKFRQLRDVQYHLRMIQILHFSQEELQVTYIPLLYRPGPRYALFQCRPWISPLQLL